jgi:hypothetical protein
VQSFGRLQNLGHLALGLVVGLLLGERLLSAALDLSLVGPEPYPFAYSREDEYEEYLNKPPKRMIEMQPLDPDLKKPKPPKDPNGSADLTETVIVIRNGSADADADPRVII